MSHVSPLNLVFKTSAFQQLLSLALDLDVKKSSSKQSSFKKFRSGKSRVQELNLPEANYEFAAYTARPTLVVVPTITII